jgi:hypothetical protein
MNSLSVAVANLPTASLALTAELTAELAEPGTPLLSAALFLFEFFAFSTDNDSSDDTSNNDEDQKSYYS